MPQPAFSLIRYENPVLVSKSDPTHAKEDKKALTKKLPPVEDKGRPKTPTQTEDILSSILPPR
jgi:dynein light intermediate chain